MEMLSQKQKIIAFIVIIIAIIIIAIYYINSTKEIYSYEEFDSNTSDMTETKEEKNSNIIIHIAGAVKKNGIVEVKANARINDVVEAAGGLSENADLDQVNLAYVVEDEQKIYIPSKQDINIETEDIIQEEAGNNVTEEIREENKKININKATSQELLTLSGIGEVMANKIIEYRNTIGRFNAIEDIKNVPGIGEAKYESIKNFISV